MTFLKRSRLLKLTMRLRMSVRFTWVCFYSKYICFSCSYKIWKNWRPQLSVNQHKGTASWRRDGFDFPRQVEMINVRCVCERKYHCEQWLICRLTSWPVPSTSAGLVHIFCMRSHTIQHLSISYMFPASEFNKFNLKIRGWAWR